MPITLDPDSTGQKQSHHRGGGHRRFTTEDAPANPDQAAPGAKAPAAPKSAKGLLQAAADFTKDLFDVLNDPAKLSGIKDAKTASAIKDAVALLDKTYPADKHGIRHYPKDPAEMDKFIDGFSAVMEKDMGPVAGRFVGAYWKEKNEKNAGDAYKVIYTDTKVSAKEYPGDADLQDGMNHANIHKTQEDARAAAMEAAMKDPRVVDAAEHEAAKASTAPVRNNVMPPGKPVEKKPAPAPTEAPEAKQWGKDERYKIMNVVSDRLTNPAKFEALVNHLEHEKHTEQVISFSPIAVHGNRQPFADIKYQLGKDRLYHEILPDGNIEIAGVSARVMLDKVLPKTLDTGVDNSGVNGGSVVSRDLTKTVNRFPGGYPDNADSARSTALQTLTMQDGKNYTITSTKGKALNLPADTTVPPVEPNLQTNIAAKNNYAFEA